MSKIEYQEYDECMVAYHEISAKPIRHSKEIQIISIRTKKESINKLTIPSEIKGKTVTSINMRAVTGRIEELIVPATVEHLSEGAFMDANVGKIVFEGNVNKIPESCFQNCDATEIIFTHLDKITEVGYKAFFKTKSLKKFVWPINCCYIPIECFGCSGISEIHMPNVTQIYNGAFKGTPFLCEVDWPVGCATIPAKCFSGSAITHINGIENSVKTIRACAFYCTANLKEIKWPRNCSIIPNSCFCHSGIKKITIHPSIARIDREAFAGTKNLKEYEWPLLCENVPSNCFSSSGIERITGIENVRSIEPGAFHDLMNLREIIWPGAVWLCSSVLTGCNSLTRVKFMGERARLCLTTLRGSNVKNGCLDFTECDEVEVTECGQDEWGTLNVKAGFNTIIQIRL